MSQTSSVIASDGTKLHAEHWAPDADPRFVVVIVHGLAEHVGRYDHMARRWNQHGAFVVGADHRGQGLSGGTPGHVDGFTQYAEDLRAVIQAAYATHPRLNGLPLFIFGHSMGGLIALTYLLEYAADGGSNPTIRGALISAPLLEVAAKVPLVKRVAAKIADKVAPRLGVPAGLPSEAISRDPEQVRIYDADSRRVTVVSARWNSSMEAATARARQEVDKLTLPMLWYAGTGDRLCKHEATVAAHGRLRAAEENDQTLRVFEGYFHELHNEPEDLRAPVLEMVEEWMLERV